MTVSRFRSDGLSELDPAARLRVRVAGLLTALAASVLLLLPADPPLSQPLFDLFQDSRRIEPVSSRVQIVGIDERSLARFGGWPWSRFDMAALVGEIQKRGATAIGFDLLFPEPDRLTPQQFTEYYPELTPGAADEIRALKLSDALFANVIGSGPVVLARVGVPADAAVAADAAAPLPPEAQFTGRLPSGVQSFPRVLANLDILEGSAIGRGLVNGEPDADGVIRRVPLVARAQGAATPSLALELVRVAEGEPPIELQTRGGVLRGVRVGEHRVRTDPQGRLQLRFRDVLQGQTSSPIDIAEGRVRPDAFRGKIVLIGLTSAGTVDVVTTPREPQTYGVYVQAQAIDAILRSLELTSPVWGPPLEWGIGVAIFLAVWFFLARLRLLAIVGLSSLLWTAAIGVSWLAFQKGLLLDPAPMVVPGAVATAAMISLLFVEGNRVRSRLRADLEDQRLSAAHIEGELAAASEIQSGMLLPRASLKRISPAMEIDAVLQPARTVGGDLYDAFMMDAHRLCFLVGDVTGKGVPASLFMALSKALSRSLLMRPDVGLDAAIAGINAELSRDNGQAMAVSLLVGVLHLDDGRLDLCSAGHENPLVVGPDGVAREIVLDGGPPLCVDETFPYPVETHRLVEGEILVAFTDGLTEAQSPDADIFGRDRAFAAVAKAAKAESLDAMVDAIVAAVRAFEDGSEPSDDLTVLALRRRPSASRPDALQTLEERPLLSGSGDST
jgi:serine phosphatase RsbU (regulator of sigma subunit)/CHASE2 domain-containing sensor protein